MDTKTLHIEGFPEDIMRALKAKAALEGVTIKSLVIDTLRKATKDIGRDK